MKKITGVFGLDSVKFIGGETVANVFWVGTVKL